MPMSGAVARTTTAPGVAGLLDGLPEGHLVVGVGEDTLVVGPTGAFVIGAAGQDHIATAERVGRRAETLRGVLASVLPWTPFVDALVVADLPVGPVPGASVVPPWMLLDTLLSGPRLLDPAVVVRIASVLSS